MLAARAQLPAFSSATCGVWYSGSLQRCVELFQTVLSGDPDGRGREP